MATGKSGSGIRVTKDRLPELEGILDLLGGLTVVVGFPDDTSDRPIDPENPDGDITNAQLGYIHDNGAPEENIPARPFMEPGIASVKDDLTAGLVKVGRAAFNGADKAAIEKGLHKVGFTAKLGIQRKIQEGVPPPLSERTLRARLKRGRKGAAQELDRRWDGQEPSVAYAKPLVDTAEMLKAVDYAIRNRSADTATASRRGKNKGGK